MPIKSYSKDVVASSSYTINTIGSTKFEPNFHSDAYKEQAKASFNRRMHYNPRDAASKPRPPSAHSHSSPYKQSSKAKDM